MRGISIVPCLWPLYSAISFRGVFSLQNIVYILRYSVRVLSHVVRSMMMFCFITSIMLALFAIDSFYVISDHVPVFGTLYENVV
jgi:hypothetical protein